MRSKWAALLCLASVTLSPVLPAMAQEIFVPYEDAGTAMYDGSAVYTGAAPLANGGYLFFRKDFDSAVGYNDGYSSVGWFQPLPAGFFGQAQFFVTDNGEFGGSLNGGWRTFVDSQNRVYGAYGGIDFDESVRGNRYEQISIGVETLGQMWDFRLNGYFPLDRDANFEGVRSLGTMPTFQGNNLVLLGTAFYEKPMPGADVEWGFPILDPSGFGRLRSYFGGYIYDAEDKNPAGIRVRLESHLNEHVTLGAAFFHDDVNGGMATASVDIRGWSRSLPGLNNKTPSNEAKMYLPIVRNYRVAADNYTDNFSAAALDANGNELDFVWVNNGNAAPGSGTFEDPFHDMPATAPGADYILVWQGPSSINNPVLGGIALEDGQRLFGEGFRFFIDVTGTKFGAMPGTFAIDDIVPNWGVQGQRPTLSNPGGDVITLASNNLVRSFNIVSSGGHGITGTGITNFDLRDLTIGNQNPAFGNAGAGIFLTDASGVGIVNNFDMYNNAGGGVIVRNTSVGPLDLLLNASNANPGYNIVGGQFGLNLEVDDAVINADVNNFRNSGSGEGMVLRALNGGELNVDVDTGSFDNTTVGDGILVQATDSAVNLTMLNTTAINAAGNGFNIELDNSEFAGDVQSTALGNSSFSGAGLNGVRLVADNSPSVDNFLHFINTTIDNSGQALDPVDNDGLHIVLTNGTFFDVEFRNGSIQNSGGSAVFEDISGGSTLDILINPSNLNNSGEDGVRIIADASTIIHRIFDTTINGSGQAGIVGAGNGIYATLTNGADVQFNMSNSQVNESNEHGLFIEASGGSVFNTPIDLAATPALNGIFSTTFNDSNLSGGAFDGIHVRADGALTDVTLLLTDVQVTNTAAGGLQQNALDFFIDDLATFNFSAVDAPFGIASTFSDSEEDGVFGLVTNGAVANVLFSGVPIDNSGRSGTGSGMNLTVLTASELNVTVEDGSISGSADHGVVFDAQDAGTLATLLVDNTIVDDNGADGVNLNASFGAAMEAEIVNGSSVSDNALNGIIAAADGPGTTLDLTVEDSTVDDNQGGDGINLFVSDTAVLNASVIDSSVSGNDDDGISLTSLGGTNGGATSSLTIEGSTIDDNDNGYGIDINLSDLTDPTGAHIHTTSIVDSSASGNALDGIRLQANGSATDATLHAGFDPLDPLNTSILGLIADGNGGNGWNLQIHDDALFTAVINNSSGSDNEVNGFLLEATGAGTIVRVNTTGGNQFDDNVNGYGALVNASGIAELEAVVGGGSNNGLGGVEINADNVTLITNVGVVGPTVVNGNTGNGIFLNLFDNTTIQNVTISDVTANNNTEEGILISLVNNTNPIGNVSILNTTVGNSGQNGASLIATDNDIVDILFDGLAVSGSQGLNATAGDGILVQLLNANVTGAATITNGGSASNARHGLNIDLDNSDIAALNITGNSLGGIGGLVGLEFNLVGNTFPGGVPSGAFTIQNTSPLLDIVGFTFDISTAVAGAPVAIFDTQGFGSFPFTPFGGTDVTTGLESINGVVVVPPIVPGPGAGETQDDIGTILPGGGVPGDTSVLNLTFLDFNPGEIFQWDIDADVDIDNDSTVTGAGLVGSFIRVDFAGGLFIEGSLLPAGPGASTFVATSGNISSPGFSENGGNGILINQRNGSDIGALNISDNLIDANNQHGIEFLVSASDLPGPGNAALISGNEITNQVNGDGIRLVNPDTGAAGAGGNAIAMDFIDNTITGNLNGSGINIELNENSTQAGTPHEFSYEGNTISNNGNVGSRFIAVDDVEYTLNYGQTPGANQNVIEGNNGGGILIDVSENTIGDIRIANTAVRDTIGGDGLSVLLSDNARVNTLDIGGTGFPRNTEFSGNDGHGILLQTFQSSRLYNPTIQYSIVSDNGGDGIQFVRRAGSRLDDIVIFKNLINGNTGDGIEFDLQGGRTDLDAIETPFIISALIQGNQINENDGNGIFMNLDADVYLDADIGGATANFNDIVNHPTLGLGNQIFNSGLSGIQATVRFDASLDGTWDNNFIRDSGRLAAADGINLTLSQRSFAGVAGPITISNSEISGSSRDGVRVATGNSLPGNIWPRALVDIIDNGPQFLTDTRGIYLNDGHGVNLLASAVTELDAVVHRNAIAGNGLNGINADSSAPRILGTGGLLLAADDNMIVANAGDGVSLNTTGNGTLNATADSNIIFRNEQHGVNLNTAGDSRLNVSLSDNQILENAQRGVSLVNRNIARTNLSITGTVDPRTGLGSSRIEQNGEVGVYIENNAGQINTDSGDSNRIEFLMHRTAVIGNGTNTAVAADDRNGVFIRVGTSSFGFVNATVTENFFDGNGNIDFVTQSFTATPTPSVISQYTNPDNHIPDPLARLGLIFTNNMGDSIDVTRFGATYNNADQFKSPLAIFTTTSRLRNAQRFASPTAANSVRNDSVQAAPAPTATQFAGANAAGIGPNNTLAGLGILINGDERDITAFAGGLYTVNPAIGIPVAGDGFNVRSRRIAGVGTSTFRVSNTSTVLNGDAFVGTENQFSVIISGFGDGVNLIDGTIPGGNPDDNPAFFGGVNLDFDWDSVAAPLY